MKLYAKLIVWFLLANVVAVAVTVLVGSRLWLRSYSEDEAGRDANAAVETYESGGAGALENWLRERREAGVFGILSDERGAPLAHAHLPLMPFGRDSPLPPRMRDEPGSRTMTDERPAPFPSIHDRLRAFQEGHEAMLEMPGGERLRGVWVVSARGTKYRWVATAGPPRGPRARLYEAVLHIGVGLIVIAAVALFAARRITRPITGLREATIQVAGGRLQTRVAADIAQRGDELGELGRAFNDMAQRLQHLLESQRQLLRDVSHELRSPLARLRIAAELARTTPEPTHFERIEQESDRLEELISQVLLVARLDSPVEAGAAALVDLANLIAHVCEDARLESAPRQVSIDVKAQGGCIVRGQPDLLQSAVENVVRNAIRYTAAGSTVRIAMERRGHEATIAISDQGPGVPQDQLAAIFKPFHRVSSARERDSGGYGLGLAIAERAIAAHGGSISAQNVPGGGLRVEIRLPLDGQQQISHGQ